MKLVVSISDDVYNKLRSADADSISKECLTEIIKSGLPYTTSLTLLKKAVEKEGEAEIFNIIDREIAQESPKDKPSKNTNAAAMERTMASVLNYSEAFRKLGDDISSADE